MNCFETQSIIMKYVNEELSGARLEAFLEHIEKCSNCREELEIYFTLMTGMKQLDEDKVLTDNFHKAFENRLLQSKKMLEKNNKGFWIKIMIVVWTILASMILLTGDCQRDGKGISRSDNLKDEINNLQGFSDDESFEEDIQVGRNTE